MYIIIKLHTTYMAITYNIHGNYIQHTWQLHTSYMAITYIIHGNNIQHT